MDKQEIYTVEDTNADAMASKLSAVNKGYLEDDFAKEFVQEQERKDIIIHRGYWGRVNIFQLLLERFLLNSSNIKKQIISLGCGYDTNYYMLKKNPQFQNLDFLYVELDLENVVKNKIKKIEKSTIIQQVIGEHKLNEKKTELNSKNYCLYPQNLIQQDNFIQNLKNAGVDLSIPTFFFAECVFTYIETKHVDSLIKLIQDSFEVVYLASYEMMNPHDQFGKMMVKNFERKGCPLVGIFDYPDIKSQQQRLYNLGFQNVEVYSMLDVYNHYTDQKEKKRIEKIEMMDEFEEWNIMQKHYFVSLTSKYSQSAQNNNEFQQLFHNLKINQNQ
ncbi:leucine carboxyl methyltransferase family protein, putative [Ichthyophthirius multifiliis]|uniref:Leucine carboxyl methyltransferase 1 n=1 Tax=Ichthyophthirius multifiliis TaxID=5932 RepID=G0R6A6_ICHMU|nr:leucine carboxyl methyltransferase family protein, putative [Ichthyophthirius multifiliis]EGR27003.1 leucine carboxyl methyltransferase family protein, putative [Ichthyophthirius multifiliis]|eukprot:XP_004023887.1 leucine carboxyl methyltransferase family protein, putative [Ichthyophthirius multifiliis]